MPPRSQFALADKAFGGGLAEELTRLREAKVSHEQIARWLLTEHGIEVAGETVRRWVRDLPEPEREAEAVNG